MKTEAISASSSSDGGRFFSDITFGGEFESKHPLTQASKGRESNLRKMILPFSSPQIQLWPVCNASAKATQERENLFSQKFIKESIPS